MSFPANLLAVRGPLVSFAVMGAMWGTIAADLPDLKAMLGVDEALLGLLLFPTPVAAVIAMFLVPHFARMAGRHALLFATFAMPLVFALPGQFSTVWAFALAMMACGAATGLADVLMTARVSAIEAERGESLMNLCFAAYSFGYAAGAMTTGGLRAMDWPPSSLLLAVAGVAGVVAQFSYEKDGAITGLNRPREKGAARLGMVPVLGGAVMFIAFLTENASENWAALYIETTLGGSPVQGGMGPAIIALTMGVSRLFGQGFANRFQPARLLVVAAIIGAGGLLLAASAQGPGLAYLGFIIAGIGASVLSPTAFSMVGSLSRPEVRTRAIARATMIGYLGYFVGPPAFGALAGGIGLRSTFVIAAALLAAILVVGPMLARKGLR